MSMIKQLKKGGRKSTATLLTMFIITGIFLLQYPQITALMLLDYKEVCFDTAYIAMYPRMSTTEYVTGMVTLIGLFAGANAYTYSNGSTNDNSTEV